MTPDLTLDAEVRRVDEDRWLASRFAPAHVRARLIAIYALNAEIAKTAEVVTQAQIGDIRLAWWREAIEEIRTGKPTRAHPVLQAYAAARGVCDDAAWDAIIDARAHDLDAAPFETWDDLNAYIDATAGGVMRLALAACDAAAPAAFISAAAQAWGSVGLLRAAKHWHARGRQLLPRSGGSTSELVARASRAYQEARATTLSSAAFPALGYVALTGSYLRALQQDRTERPLFKRQLKLVLAAATGKI